MMKYPLIISLLVVPVVSGETAQRMFAPWGKLKNSLQEFLHVQGPAGQCQQEASTTTAVRTPPTVLTWPLFVHMSNHCLDPGADAITTSFSECLVACTDPSDVSRSLCERYLEQNGCAEELETCFTDAIDSFDPRVGDKAVPKLQAPAEFAKVIYDGDCCNTSFVRVDLQEQGPEAAHQVLQKCGFVLLPQLLDHDVAVAAGGLVNRTLVDPIFFREHFFDDDCDYEDLLDWYQEQVRAAAETGIEEHGECEDTDDLTNLRGGRYELVLPQAKESHKLLTDLRESGLKDLLRTAFRGDEPQLLYANILSQTSTGITSNTGQERHVDSHTVEEIKVQIAVHEWTIEDGGTQFIPGSHRFPQLFDDYVPFTNFFDSGMNIDLIQDEIVADYPELCLGFSPTSVEPGDVALYYSGTEHGGRPNLTGRRRSFVDIAVHSATNEYYASERDDAPYAGFDDEYEDLCEDAEENPEGQWICDNWDRIVSVYWYHQILFNQNYGSEDLDNEEGSEDENDGKGDEL